MPRMVRPPPTSYSSTVQPRRRASSRQKPSVGAGDETGSGGSAEAAVSGQRREVAQCGLRSYKVALTAVSDTNPANSIDAKGRIGVNADGASGDNNIGVFLHMLVFCSRLAFNFLFMSRFHNE